MGDEIGRVDLGLNLDRRGFQNQLFGLAGSASTNMITKAFAPIGKMIGSALAIGGLTAFTKSCLDLGSNLAEVQNVVDVTFGDMTDKVNAFASTAIDTFGLSETAAKKMMGTYGAMSKAFGFTTEQAYEMSEAITGLTADVASFYNLSTDEAETKLKSIWTGETESLKSLGVVMTQTALNEYALNNGFGKTTAKMTEQEKVMLRYQFVMSRLRGASGDFARTQDGWANQTRILTLRFQQLKATIGQGLINLFTPIIKSINSMLVGLQKLADGFSTFTALLTGKKQNRADLFGKVSEDAGDAADNIGGIGDATEEAAKKASRALAGFDAITKLSELSSGGGTGAGIVTPTVDPGDTSTSLVEEMTNAIEKADFSKFGKTFGEKLVKALNEFSWTDIKDRLNGVAANMAELLNGFIGTPELGYSIGNSIANMLDLGISSASKFIKDLDWSKLGSQFAELLNGFFSDDNTLAEDFGELIANGVNGAADFIIAFLDDVSIENIYNSVRDAIVAFKDNVDWDDLAVACASLAAIALAGFAGKIVLTGITTAFTEWVTVTMVPALCSALGAASFAELTVAFGGAIAASFAGFKIGNYIYEGISGESVDIDWKEYIGENFDIKEWTDAWSEMWCEIMTPVFDIPFNAGEKLGQKASELYEAAKKIGSETVQSIKDGVTAKWEDAKKFFEDKKNDILGKFSGMPGKVKEYAGSMLSNMKKGFTVNSIGEHFQGVVDRIARKIGKLPGIFKQKSIDMIGNMKGILNVNGIGAYFKGVVNKIGSVIQKLPELFLQKSQDAVACIKGIFNYGGIGAFFAGLVDVIKGKFKNIGSTIGDVVSRTFNSAMNTCFGTVETIVNWFIRRINKILGALRGSKLLGGLVKGLDDIEEIKMPRLANGCYVKPNTPQLAMIGDNLHQGEVVAPEDKLRSLLDEATKQSADGSLTSEVVSLLKEILHVLRNLNVDVYIDGKKVTDRVVSIINANTRATGICEIKL